MNVSEKIFEKDFKAYKMKDAYLEACKWVSSNIIAKNNSNNITYKMEKKEGQNSISKIHLTIYVTIDEQEVLERNCSICKEFNDNYFSCQNKYLCEVCRMPPYRNRLKERLESIKAVVKEKIFL